jgi:hypothetical protein
MFWIRVSALALGAAAMGFGVVSAQSSAPAAQSAPVASDSPTPAMAVASSEASDSSSPEATTAPVIDATRVAYVIHSKKPTFMASSVGTVEFGVIGVLASMSIGDQIIADNHVDDPANAMAAQVAKTYAAKQGGLEVDTPLTLGEHQTLNDATDLKARYVVVVTTESWGYLYFPFDWTHYGVLYGASLVVVDRATNTDVITTHCFVKPVKAGAPNHDELLSNGAAGLKALLVTAGQTCLTQMQNSTPELKAPAS